MFACRFENHSRYQEQTMAHPEGCNTESLKKECDYKCD